MRYKGVTQRCCLKLLLCLDNGYQAKTVKHFSNFKIKKAEPFKIPLSYSLFYLLSFCKLPPDNIEGAPGFEPLNLLLIVSVIYLDRFAASISMVQYQLQRVTW